MVAVLVMAGGFAATQITVDYYELSPGPVNDVAGLLTIDAAGPGSDGELLFLTVMIEEVSAFDWVLSQFDGASDLRPAETIRPAGLSDDEQSRISRQQMAGAKDVAAFVALDRLGYDVSYRGAGARLIDVVPDGPAATAGLAPGDVIVEFAGVPVEFAEGIAGILPELNPGEPVSVVVRNEDDPESQRAVDLLLAPREDDPARAFIGAIIETADLFLDVPLDLAIETNNIGGPSAGMMFALGIIDRLTEADLTGGHRIAGTGTIAVDGDVGPIGGVRQKVIAAAEAGADYVLVPVENAAAAVGAADVEVTGGDAVEHRSGALFELGPVRDVVPQRRPGDEQRALDVQYPQVKRWDGAARLAEEHHRAPRAQQVETGVEGVGAHRVVHHVEGMWPEVRLGGFDEVLVGVADDEVGAAGRCHGLLLVGGHGGGHLGSEALRHLDDQPPHSAGTGMDEASVARAERVGVVDQVVGGHTLQQYCGGGTVVDAVGDGHHLVGGGGHQLRVAAGDTGDGDPIAGGEPGDRRAHLGDGPGGLGAGDERRHGRIETGAVVDVDEVHPGGGNPDEHLVRLRPGIGYLAGHQCLGSAVGSHSDGSHTSLLSLGGG
jgi:PDZ domain-containing protein